MICAYGLSLEAGGGLDEVVEPGPDGDVVVAVVEIGLVVVLGPLGALEVVVTPFEVVVEVEAVVTGPVPWRHWE